MATSSTMALRSSALSSEERRKGGSADRQDVMAKECDERRGESYWKPPFARAMLSLVYGCFQQQGKTPKWMVKIMENPIKMDDLGGKPTILGNTHYIPGDSSRALFGGHLT